MLETLAGFLLIAGNVVNQPRVQFLENRVPVGPGEVIDRRDGALGIVGAVCAPASKQSGSEIGDRSADRLCEILARGGVLLALETAYAKHQPGNAVTFVDLYNALGEFHRFIDFSIDKERQEGAIEQLAIVRVALESRTVVGGGGPGVALLASVTRGEVTSRSRRAGKFQGARRLRGKCDRCCHDKGGKRAAGNAAAEARRRHGRCSNETAVRGLHANTDVTPRMAFLRRSRKNVPQRRGGNELESPDVAVS